MTPSIEELQQWQKVAAEEDIRDGVVVSCPCGQPVALGFQNDEAVVLHRLPMCAKFEELEPDEYATYVRQAAIKAMGGEVGA